MSEIKQIYIVGANNPYDISSLDVLQNAINEFLKTVISDNVRVSIQEVTCNDKKCFIGIIEYTKIITD